MEVDFKYLRKICPRYNKSNGLCMELKYYDCSESNCPMNAAHGKQAAQTNNSQSMPLSKDKPVPREGFTLNEGLWPNKRR